MQSEFQKSPDRIFDEIKHQIVSFSIGIQRIGDRAKVVCGIDVVNPLFQIFITDFGTRFEF